MSWFIEEWRIKNKNHYLNKPKDIWVEYVLPLSGGIILIIWVYFLLKWLSSIATILFNKFYA